MEFHLQRQPRSPFINLKKLHLFTVDLPTETNSCQPKNMGELASMFLKFRVNFQVSTLCFRRCQNIQAS